MSKQEDFLYSELTKICPRLFFHRNYRPDFLKNLKTGKNLEIDIWCPYYKIGFEYQGAVHFMEIRRFENDPDKSRLHDVYKSDMIDERKTKDVIVEIFEKDLRGSVKFNLVKRIENTINYYKQKGGYRLKIEAMNNFIIYLNYYTHLRPRQIREVYTKPYRIDKRRLREVNNG